MLLLLGAAPASEAPRARLTEALVQHVAAKVGVAPGDVEVQHLGVAELPACAEDATFLVESAPGERFLGSADVQVLAYTETARCALLRLQPRLLVWRAVPVATAPANPGEVVRWAPGRVPLGKLVGAPLDPDRLETGQWVARTTLPENTPLTDLVVRPAPDGPRGQEVVLMAGARDLLVAAPGRLMGDAFLGERVTIANLASGAVVTGTLLAPACAAVGPVTPRIQEACDHAQVP